MSVQNPASIYHVNTSNTSNTQVYGNNSGTDTPNSIFENYSSSDSSFNAQMAISSLDISSNTERKMQNAKEDAEKEKQKLAKLEKEIKKLEKQIAEENRSDNPDENKISNLRLELTKLKGKARTAKSKLSQAATKYNNAKRTYESESLIDKITSPFRGMITAAANAADNAVNDFKTSAGINKPVSIPSGEKASTLGSAAENVAMNMNTSGWCYRGVINSLKEIGVTGLTGGSAYMAADQLANRGDFQEITGNFSKSSELKDLPAGAVVVWDKGAGGMSAQHGHISIALGDGREASDCIRNQLTGGGNCNAGRDFRVFMPV